MPPTKGATAATASSGAVSVNPARGRLAPKSPASVGRIAWVAYRLMKVASPAAATPARRRPRQPRHSGACPARIAGAGRRQHRRARRRPRRRGMVQLREPPVQRGVAPVPGGRRRLVPALRLARRAAEVQVHVRGVAVPGPDQVQPGPVSGGDPAKLRLDGRVDQHAVNARQLRRQADQGDVGGQPSCRVHPAAVRRHQAADLDAVQLGRRQRRLRLHVQPDVGIQARACGWRGCPASARRAGGRCRSCTASAGPPPHARARQRLQRRDGVGMAPEPAPAGADRLVARPGRRAAPPRLRCSRRPGRRRCGRGWTAPGLAAARGRRPDGPGRRVPQREQDG